MISLPSQLSIRFVTEVLLTPDAPEASQAMTEEIIGAQHAPPHLQNDVVMDYLSLSGEGKDSEEEETAWVWLDK